MRFALLLLSSILVILAFSTQFSSQTVDFSVISDGLKKVFNFWSIYSQDDSGKNAKATSSRKKRQNMEIGDESQLYYEVKSSSLPMMPDAVTVNTRYMPTLGNGHIAATVYDNRMYMNGLYEGIGEDSHRAHIPALLMGRVNFSVPEIDRRATRKYIFNARDGYYMETIDSELAYIEHKLYIHQKYIRLFVSDIYVVTKPSSFGGGTLIVNYPHFNATDDIVFSEQKPFYGTWQLTGRTKTAEQGKQPQMLHIFYQDPLKQIPVLPAANSKATYTMKMALDKQESNARTEFDIALRLDAATLFAEHVAAWRRSWSMGNVQIEGNLQLSKIVTFAQYYILSSLPPEFPHTAQRHDEILYGIGRTSLAKGGKGKDYQGHVMWDNEMYILPAVLPFHPELAKKMLRYRSSMALQAEENAKRFGGTGYHFPWRSAFSGHDVSPMNCGGEKCHWKKYMPTVALAYAIRHFYSFTRDRDYVTNTDYESCKLMREIARFLAGQAVFNEKVARYDMKDITGPDQFHEGINNNAFILAASSQAIHWARYYTCICQGNERVDVPDAWINKAFFFNLPFDNVRRLHYQYEGFSSERDAPIGQADTVMLNFPLNWNMSTDIMKNDLEFYERLTDDRSPAMTWSWFTIGWKWVKDDSKLLNYFERSYQNYIIQPFKIWTEHNERSFQDQLAGAVNFLPGMGGFLQSFIYGFAGIRIRPDKLEFHNPITPPSTSRLILNGLQYLRNNLTIIIDQQKTVIVVNAVNQQNPLVLKRNSTRSAEERLVEGAEIIIDKPSGGFYIYSSIQPSCEHPRDYIFMPWGYSPWISGASSLRRLTQTLAILLMIFFSTLLVV